MKYAIFTLGFLALFLSSCQKEIETPPCKRDMKTKKDFAIDTSQLQKIKSGTEYSTTLIGSEENETQYYEIKFHWIDQNGMIQDLLLGDVPVDACAITWKVPNILNKCCSLSAEGFTVDKAGIRTYLSYFSTLPKLFEVY